MGRAYVWTSDVPAEDPPEGMGWVVRTGSAELYLIDNTGAYVYAPLEAAT
jgi:hypothetical protein